MKDWKNIHEEILKAKEPLSVDAWKNMKTRLGKTRRGKAWWIISLLLLAGIFIGGTTFLLHEEPEYYQSRIHPAKEPTEKSSEEMAADMRVQTVSVDTTNSKKTQQFAEHQQAQYPDQTGQKPDFHEDLKSTITENKEASGLKLTSASKLPVKSLTRVIEPQLPLKLVMHEELHKELPATRSPQKRFELRFFAAPTYNFSSLEYHTQQEKTHKHFANAINEAVKPGWGIDAGVELRYRLFSNFMVSSGFTYREIVTRNNYNFELRGIPVIDSATGNILGYIPINTKEMRREFSKNTYSFIDIPISLYYEKPLGGRWILTGEAINHISFLLGHSAKSIDPTSLELSNSNDDIFNPVINSYQLRLGLRYQLKKNLFLAVEPAYRSYYQDFLKDENISWKPRDFSVSFSTIYIIN